MPCTYIKKGPSIYGPLWGNLTNKGENNVTNFSFGRNSRVVGFCVVAFLVVVINGPARIKMNKRLCFLLH